MKITNRDVGMRLFEIVSKIQDEKALSSNDKNFISHWLEKCIDQKKILDELNIAETYKESNLTINSLSDIVSKLKSGISFDNVCCPVFILDKGSIENYCNDTSHSIKGALKFLSELKTYFRDNKNDNPKFESSKSIVSDIVNSNYERTTAFNNKQKSLSTTL